MNVFSPSGRGPSVLAELRQKPGRIFVWLFSLTPASPDTPNLAILSPDEQERACRFHFERDRTRFTVARGKMRTILGGCIGVPADQVRFRSGVNGKPELADPSSGLHFNLSHSGDWAILAVAGAPVGVDLEQIDMRVKAADLARRFFSVEDRAWLDQMKTQPEALQRAFFRLWVTREAWLKATGDGLSFPLDQLITEWTGTSMTGLRERNGKRRGTVRELAALPPNYCAAVAMEQDSLDVTWMHLPAFM